MVRHIIIISLVIFRCASIFCQKQEKIYYDKDWKVTTQSKAEYFRIINFDQNGKSIGIVKDYYITGELQWEGEFSYVDKYDNSKDVNEGLSIWYYKSGQKSRESTFIHDIENGQTTYWYVNGRKAREVLYKNGIPNGKWIDYYENGKIKFFAELQDGYPIDRWVVDCDEFEHCQNVFLESFSDNNNPNEWPLLNENCCKSNIIEGEGLMMKTTGDQGFAQFIRLPIDIENDFSIETLIQFNSGDDNSGHGLIWGMKDWENYYYFYISANGYYSIGAISEGLRLEFKKWTESQVINKKNNGNVIKVTKKDDKVYYSINGEILETSDFYSFKGNVLGFQIVSGKKEILFKSLVVRQDLTYDINTNFPIVSANNWKGNGTGFFIDTKGYIATNFHVVDGASEIEISYLQNGQKNSYKASILSSDKQNDLAILKIVDPNFKQINKIPFKLRTQITDVGSSVFVLGYPLALDIMGEEIKFTDGKISSKTGFQGDITTYQVSVPLQPGNSGGPLFDYDGNIIGIVNAKIMAAENVSYAIKSNYLISLIDVLPEKLVQETNNSLINTTLTEKIKILSEYVVMIKIR